MTDDQNRSDARAGLRGPPEVSFLKAVSNFDGCRCCRWTRSAPATKRKIYRMHKRLSPQRDTGKPNQTENHLQNRRAKHDSRTGAGAYKFI